MYEITLDALREAKNDRLWFNTNLKLAKVYIATEKVQETEKVLLELKKCCQNPDGSDDTSKGTSLIEIYCLEIRLCATTSNHKRMKEIYPKTLNLRNAISHPRIRGQIREEGGKMHMSEGNWTEAYNELFASFLAYQEAGDQRAKSTLKYLVVASLLALSKINPFSAKEANVYAEDKEIIAMVELRQALEATDLPKFERVLKDKRNRIQDEPFLVKYIEPLRKRMREQVLLDITRPYNKVTFSFLVVELLMSQEEVEALLIEMILDHRLTDATVDQVKGCVIFNRLPPPMEDREMEQIMKLADMLSVVSSKVCVATS
jgi:COP9 signalosome complex subunit 2